MATRHFTNSVAHLASAHLILSSQEQRVPSAHFPVPPEPGCEVSVVIPAKNEADSLERTLAALANQIDASGCPLNMRRYEILVLVNNSSDASAHVARRFSRRTRLLKLHVAEINFPERVAHVGQARRLLMDAAWHRLMQSGRPRGIIATTDADTVVSATWVDSTINAVRNGADAVGGRILIAPDELRSMDAHALRFHLLDVGYRSLLTEVESLIDPDPGDPWPRHFQHFGASLAVTAEAYEKAGGLPIQPCLEDVALHAQLERIGATIRHSPDVRVSTSARPHGRTGFGFAVQLGQWSEMCRAGHPLMVRSANDVIDEFRTRNALRRFWTRNSELSNDIGFRQLSHQTGVPATLIQNAFWTNDSFTAAWLQIREACYQENARIPRFPLVDIKQAISELRTFRSLLVNQRPG
jgi:hypothetical protein